MQIFTLWASGHDPLVDIQQNWCLDDLVKAQAALELKSIMTEEMAAAGRKNKGR